MTGRVLEYLDGDLTMAGYLAEPEGHDRRPAVLVVPAGPGLAPMYHERADALTRLGYIALVVDLYGNGAFYGHTQEVFEKARAITDQPGKLLHRVKLALDRLAGLDRVDPGRVGAIGYCMGGMGVLELARSGAPVKAVVSFHGKLTTSSPSRPVAASILVCTGTLDPNVPAGEVAAFCTEMESADADYQIIMFGKAGHAFTDVELPARPDGPFGPHFGYQHEAAQRSWSAMCRFFEERLS